MALKNRLIFELLFSDGSFVQSRNFSHQKVGSIEWLLDRYDLHNLSKSVDEIFITDLSQGPRPSSKFESVVAKIIDKVRIPVCLGGGVASVEDANRLLGMGADKIIVNTGYFEEPDQIAQAAAVHGKQFMVLSIDWMLDDVGNVQVMKSRGRTKALRIENMPWDSVSQSFGEILLRSIDRDGTGNGLHVDSINFIPSEVKLPIVLSGGIGKAEHIIEGLMTPRVSGVATANLLNFIGDSMGQARNSAIQIGANLSRF
jgi:imidazole glycerol-phosphate synthase subunit HisF